MFFFMNVYIKNVARHIGWVGSHQVAKVRNVKLHMVGRS